MPFSNLRMKDPGVQGVGQISQHWEIRKLGTLGMFFKGRGIAKSDITDTGLPAITYGDIYTRYGIEAKVLDKFIAVDVALNAQEIRAGDLLFAGSGETIEDIGKTTLYSGRVPGYAGGDIIILRTDQGDPLFVSYALNSDVGTRQKSAFGRGDIIVHISAANLKQIVIPYPPEDEAKEITRFLDHKTALIDGLIAKRERQIELLQEHRTSLISRVITKGLDPNVPTKDARLHDVGEIPAHWDVKRLKHLSSYVTSGSRGWAEHYSDDGPIFLRIGNLGKGAIDLDLKETQRVTPPDSAEVERTKATPGDVLVSITANVGSVGVVPEGLGSAYINQHIALVNPIRGRILPRWLAYSLLSVVGQVQFARLLCGGTKVGLGLDDVRDLILPTPSQSEQRTIVAHLDRETAKIDTFVAKVRVSIEKLKEYRQSLISAAVTGKIDVRNHAASAGSLEVLA